ncbi:MAG: Mini-ribonuclease 3 [Lactobacillales bacterium]|jgi:ribonuclease-3 family protein|nr:Mini-ribonuclease 3 [Lactobacillales bacterium]
MDKKDVKLLNGLALAYIGDSAYENLIRHYLIETGQTRPNQLHRAATKYVSGAAQAEIAKGLLEDEWFTAEELDIYKRGRNAKSYTKAKNLDVTSYRVATGFEAVAGYLEMLGQADRLAELVEYSIKKIEESL